MKISPSFGRVIQSMLPKSRILADISECVEATAVKKIHLVTRCLKVHVSKYEEINQKTKF